MYFHLKFLSNGFQAIIHVFIVNLLFGPINADSSSNIGCGKLNIAPHTYTIKIPWEAKIERQTEFIIDISWTAVIINENLLLVGINSVRSAELLRIVPYDKYSVYTNLSRFADTDKDDRSYVHKSKITHLRPHPEYQLDDLTNAANNYVLVHLKTPLMFSSDINSVCLPNDENLNDVYQPSAPNDSEQILVSALNKFFTKTVSKSITYNSDECKSAWLRNGNETTYEDFLCANISEGDTRCIQFPRGVVAVNDLYNNGTYFFMGLISNSKNTDDNCPFHNPLFIPKLNTVTLQWIHNNTRCGPNNYTCNNGDCISLESVCNESPECADNSDEDPMFCRGLHYCDVDQYPCGTYGKCISKDNVCNSIVDCEKGEDEKFCSTSTVDTSNGIWKILGPVFAALGIAVLVTVGVYFFKKNKIPHRLLTDEEINEFKNGHTHLIEIDEEEIKEEHDVANHGSMDNCMQKIPIHENHEYLNNLIRHLKWSDTFEIAKSKVFTNKGKILGKGEYGVVYEGVYMERNSGNYSVCKNVAVKTLKSCPDIEHFKALLDELKILVYLGRHENIVELVGANTENIKLRNLEVIMEFCPHGSLKDYMQKNQDSFVSLINPIEISKQSILSEQSKRDGSEKKIFTTLDLIQWCIHVANAMDYLTSKHVIHGDLAIRNILLSFNFVAKVGDFGLSRKLYEYRSLYTHNKVALPLRWLSIESLREYAFSHKSDVWSYGVVWWELFTLGRLPYEEVKHELSLYSELCAGLRLKQPKHATEEMFNVIRTCWNSNPNSRPTFKELKNTFTIFEGHLNGIGNPSRYVKLDVN